MKVSQLVADLPEGELDINPLLVDEKGVLALDARLRVARAESPARPARHSSLSAEHEERINSGTRRLRPIRPEDEPQHSRFLAAIAPGESSCAFSTRRARFDHTQLARFTQIDYDREMAFIATARADTGDEETLGVVRARQRPGWHARGIRDPGALGCARQGPWRAVDEKDRRLTARPAASASWSAMCWRPIREC